MGFLFVLGAKGVLTFFKHSITFYIMQLKILYYRNINVTVSLEFAVLIVQYLIFFSYSFRSLAGLNIYRAFYIFIYVCACVCIHVSITVLTNSRMKIMQPH